MKRGRNTAADYAVYFLLGGVYSCSLAYIVMRSTIVPFEDHRIFLYVLLFMLLAAAVAYNAYTALAALAVGVLSYVPAAGDAWAYLTDLYWFIRGYRFYEERFAAGVIILVCSAAAVYTCIFLLKTDNFYLLAAFGVCVLAFQFAGGYIRNSAAYIFFYACLFTMAAMRLNRSGKFDRALFMLYVFPICLAVSAGAYRASGAITSYAVSSENIPKALDDLVYFMFNQKYYSFKSTGFGSNERLGGVVVPNDKFVMRVYAYGSPYLAGAVKTEYAGDRWETGPSILGGSFDQQSFAAGHAEALKMERALTDGYDGHFELTRDELTVVGSRLATLFWPARADTVTIASDRSHNLVLGPTGDLLAVPPLGLEDEYRFTYLLADYNDEAFVRYLRGRRSAGAGPEYLALPDSLPRRVYELAAELTAGHDNDYDKVKALESHITRFPYSLSPPPLPEGRDFVDYFLFDMPRGYCTYYASALAVLARCAGMPSRYVEGFIMPPFRTDGAYYVTNMQAHAWAEIYFEGFGWTPFEATPAYANRFYARPAGALGNIFTPEFFDEPDYMQYLRQYGMENESFAFPYVRAPSRTPASTTVSFMTFRVWLLIIPGPPALLTALYFMSLAFGRARTRRRIKKINAMPIDERVHAYFKGIIKMAAYYGYPVYPTETPAVYAARLGKRFAFLNESVFMRDLVAIYYRGVYGVSEVTEDEAAVIKDCYYELIKYINTYRRGPVSKLRQSYMV